MNQIQRSRLISGLLLPLLFSIAIAEGESFSGPGADSLDPLPSWIDTTFYRDMVGGLRFSGWFVMEKERRDNLMAGRPVKSLLPPHRLYVKAPGTSSEEVRVLAWYVATKTYFPWQAKDPTVPRYDTTHRVLTWIQLNDSAGARRWLLAIASLQRNSHLGVGAWVMPSFQFFLSPSVLGISSEVRNNDSLQKILDHPASEEYRQFLRSRMVRINEMRLYDHPPTTADIADFLLDYNGGSYDDPRTPAFFDPIRIYNEGHKFLLGNVRSRTWHQVTGENAPFSFPDAR